MASSLAVSFLVVGILAASWAVLMWVKHRVRTQRWNTLLMVVAGIGLGLSSSGLYSVGILRAHIGPSPIPWWTLPVGFFGFWFILEVKGIKDHHTRTPVLGFIVAVLLSMAVGNGVVAAATHGVHNIQVTSVTHRTKG